MLFATKRARPYTDTSISYLTTIVKDPDQNNWIHMVNLLNYVKGTKDIPFILSSDKSGMLKWYIDGSHSVHPNMRGHTGGVLTMGKGFPILAPSK